MCHTGEMDTRHIPPASIVARWNPSDQAVDLVIGGRTIIEVVDPQRQWGVVSPFARRFTRAAVRRWLAEYRGVFGDRDERLLEGELEVAVCGACGDLGCGNLAVYVDFNADTVVWRKPHWAGDDEADDDEPDANDPALLLPQILIFDRAEYDVALADTEGFISRPGWHRETPEAAEGDDGRQGILGPSVWLDRLRNRFTSSWDS